MSDAFDAPVTCLDLPGFGTEHRRRSPATIGRITDDVRRRFSSLRAAESWSILGISLGGMVALDWCARFPGDFERCVTLNTSASVSRWRERFGGGVRASAQTLVGPPLRRERAVLRLSSRLPSYELDAIAKRQAAWLTDTPPGRISVACQLLAAATFALPRTMTIPLLVLTSRGDDLVSWRCSAAIAATFGAALDVNPQAGHDLALDAPEWVRDAIVRWHSLLPDSRTTRKSKESTP